MNKHVVVLEFGLWEDKVNFIESFKSAEPWNTDQVNGNVVIKTEGKR